MTETGLRSRLGDVLIDAQVLTQEQLARALKEQDAWGGRLGQILLSLGMVDERTLASAIARQLGLPAVDLDAARLPANVNRLLPLEVAERYGLMPLGLRGEPKRLVVACFDPTLGEGLSAVRRATGHGVEVFVAPASAIERAIRRSYYGEATPTSIPGAGTFTITRNTIDPSTSGMVEREVVDRVAELEREVEKLKELVGSLVRPRPR